MGHNVFDFVKRICNIKVFDNIYFPCIWGLHYIFYFYPSGYFISDKTNIYESIFTNPLKELPTRTINIVDPIEGKYFFINILEHVKRNNLKIKHNVVAYLHKIQNIEKYSYHVN